MLVGDPEKMYTTVWRQMQTWLKPKKSETRGLKLAQDWEEVVVSTDQESARSWQSEDLESNPEMQWSSKLMSDHWQEKVCTGS